MIDPNKICKRCRLDDMVKGSREELEKYVASLSEDVKVSDAVYKERLSHCNDCNELLNGVCRLCGCFVLARAAKKTMYCPNEPRKWTSI